MPMTSCIAVNFRFGESRQNASLNAENYRSLSKPRNPSPKILKKKSLFIRTK